MKKIFKKVVLLYIMLICITSTIIFSTSTDVMANSTSYFGAKFEPSDPNAIYSGGSGYLPMLSMSKTGDANRKPFISQMYEPLSTLTPQRMTGETLNIQNFFPGTKIILGMALPQNDTVELAKVYDGTYDDFIHNYAENCKNLGNDIFLRIGFECDGTWNGYDSYKYKKAFQYIVNIFRNHQVNNVAFVWCVAGPTGTKQATMMNWYPGDSYVDWFGFDPYGKGDFVAGQGSDWNPAWFKKQADAHSKPIIICENSRNDTSVTLGKYFTNLFPNLKNPLYGVRGFLYQNHNATLRTKWTNWGDSIYTDYSDLIAQYNTEMQNPIYIHRDSSYYDPIALYVEASRRGEFLNGTPYDKTYDGKYCSMGYDYTVTSYDTTTQNSSGGWSWNPIWQSTADKITVDLTVPSGSSGYIILRLPSEGKMNIKLGSAPNQRTVASGIKPLNGQAYMKYKYVPSDIVNGVVSLTIENALTYVQDLRVAAIGIQTISSTAPNAPTGCTVQPGTQAGTVALRWNAVSGAIRYNIYRDGELIGTSVSTSFTDDNIPSGTHKYSLSASSLKQGEGEMSYLWATTPTFSYGPIQATANPSDWTWGGSDSSVKSLAGTGAGFVGGNNIQTIGGVGGNTDPGMVFKLPNTKTYENIKSSATATYTFNSISISADRYSVEFIFGAFQYDLNLSFDMKDAAGNTCGSIIIGNRTPGDFTATASSSVNSKIYLKGSDGILVDTGVSFYNTSMYSFKWELDNINNKQYLYIGTTTSSGLTSAAALVSATLNATATFLPTAALTKFVFNVNAFKCLSTSNQFIKFLNAPFSIKGFIDSDYKITNAALSRYPLTAGAYSVTSTTKVSNSNCTNGMDVTLIMALYRDNKLVNFTIGNKETIEKGFNKEIAVSINVNIPEQDLAKYRIKTFVLDSIQFLRPYNLSN